MKEFLEKWSLFEPEQIAKTHTSDVYKVERTDGSLAVLKHFNNAKGKADEAQGATLLRYYNGNGAIKVYESHEDAVLLEYANGKELAELVYEGKDDEATEVICDLIEKLHSKRTLPHLTSLIPLEEWFHDLFKAAETLNDPLVLKAAKVARELFKTTSENIPLHGDLHHHNVLTSDRGELAIDPKGLIGDPCYDLSNIFGNPLNAPKITTSPERQEHLAETFSQRLGYPKDRIIKFAFIHSVISTIWSGSTAEDDAERVIIAKQLEPHL